MKSLAPNPPSILKASTRPRPCGEHNIPLVFTCFFLFFFTIFILFYGCVVSKPFLFQTVLQCVLFFICHFTPVKVYLLFSSVYITIVLAFPSGSALLTRFPSPSPLSICSNACTCSTNLSLALPATSQVSCLNPDHGAVASETLSCHTEFDFPVANASSSASLCPRILP